MQNFDLYAAYDEAKVRLQLRVSDSPAGNTKQTIHSEPLTPIWEDMALHTLAYAEWSKLKQVGQTLREIVMPDPIWSLWRESVGRASAEGLRLRIRPADNVAASLPWELIYDADRNEFPALNTDTPVVRYLEGPVPARAEPLPTTLSVLITGANSRTEYTLNVKAELDRVEAALRPLTDEGKAIVTRIDELRAGRLQTPLIQKKPHIFHFAGHGDWDADTRETALLLVGAGGPDRLETDILATVLRSSSVRLVILNACDTAADDNTLWSGMAQSLVLAGVPAVVAMRYPVADGVATSFADIFYTAVAAGEPLDRALTHARQAMMGSGMRGQWLVPALFLRSDDARLWAEPVSKPTETAPRQGEVRTGGGINIGTINATNVVTGDATIDQRGSTFNVRGGSGHSESEQGQNRADERASLQVQIANIERNLLFIDERKSEFVLGTDIPIQLVKDEREARAKLAELKTRLAQLGGG